MQYPVSGQTQSLGSLRQWNVGHATVTVTGLQRTNRWADSIRGWRNGTRTLWLPASCAVTAYRPCWHVPRDSFCSRVPRGAFWEDFEWALFAECSGDNCRDSQVIQHPPGLARRRGTASTSISELAPEAVVLVSMVTWNTSTMRCFSMYWTALVYGSSVLCPADCWPPWRLQVSAESSSSSSFDGTAKEAWGNSCTPAQSFAAMLCLI